MSEKTIRPIKSYVLRTGRLTKGQQYALEHFWPLYGIPEVDSVLDFFELFGNDAPVALEIGFGNGASLAQMAGADTERNFIGIEVHTPGVGHLLHLIAENELKNLRVMDSDAVEILKRRIPDESLNRVQLYFPDPWHKKRHNKRRIIQPEFVELIATRLQQGGVFHLATDWEDYALHMAEVMENSGQFINCAMPDSALYPYSEKPDFRPMTKFEDRGLKLGHGVWDLLYYKG